MVIPIMNDNKLSIKLSFLYAAIFGGIACFNPFLTVYFQQKGLSYTQIGISYAVLSITAVITQPIWGFVTDKYSNKRTTLIIITLASSILIYNLVFAKSFYYIMLGILLITVVQSSNIPIGDAYTYEIMDTHKNIQYGRVRLVGSIGFAMVTLLLGQIIKNKGINSAYYLYSIIMLLEAILLFNIKFKDKGTKKKISLYDGTALLKDIRFSVFLLSVVIINISLGANGSYIAVLMQKTGGDVSKLGLLWCILALSELPILFFGNKILNKFGELNIYFLGIMLYGLRYFVCSVSTSYVPVLIIQTMQGLTYIFYMISAFQYINNIVPAKMRTTAMTLYSAVCGVGGLIGNMGGGVLLEHISIFMLYKIISLICIADLAVVLILKKLNSVKNYERRNVENKEISGTQNISSSCSSSGGRDL
jgi:MFS transporter, PPP family, 3-phenylpropionic acid transporter